ncbi:MAG: CapA family protein [Firmicutes bacterium]|nr:CapA family protein [Bacillota bacterium]
MTTITIFLFKNKNHDNEINISPKKISTATVGSMGDLLIHSPILKSCKISNMDYDFDSIFLLISPYIKKLDYAVINLETTLTSNPDRYSGYPTFRTPINIIDSIKKAGFNMCLFANNHSADGGEYGFIYTLDTLKRKKIDVIGSRSNFSDDKFIIKDINGIKIGFECFTYGVISKTGQKYLNGIPISKIQGSLMNIFDYSKLDEFYDEQEKIIKDMKNKGAEIIILYLHWGNEYKTTVSNYQKEISQKMCNLGVDVIIGSHPHVLQPLDILKSATSDKKTICIYSLGNAISNQRAELMNLKTGHTEDGVLFTVTFEKFDDNTVKLSDVNILPTWTKLYNFNKNKIYQIVPLEGENLNETATKKSFDRTMKLMDNGIKIFKKVCNE